jgi:hypothetical protein
VTAIHRVTCQNELGGGARKPYRILATGVNDHAIFDRFGAGNHRFILPFNLHKAETTRSRGLCLLLDGTKVGDVDAVLQCRPEKCLTLRARDLLIINCQRYVLHHHALKVKGEV